MRKTHIVLYMPDGSKANFYNVKGWNVDDKGVLWITPDQTVIGAEKSVRTTLPFKMTDE